MAISVEKMTREDLSAVLKIEKLSFSSPWSQEIFEYELSLDGAQYWAAKSEGQIVGYAGMQQVLDEGHITNLAVTPDFRGKGIGELLVAKILALAADLKLKFLTLEVRDSNAAAQKLYQDFGFTVERRRKAYYQNPAEDAVVMSLKREEKI